MPCGTAHGSRPDGQVQPLWTQQAKFRVRCAAGASPRSLSHSPKRAAARAKKGQWLGLSCGVTCGGDPNQGCSKRVYILWEHRPQRCLKGRREVGGLLKTRFGDPPPGPGASLVAQTIQNVPTIWETQVPSLGREDPPEKGTTTHSSILAQRIPWTEEGLTLSLHFNFSLVLKLGHSCDPQGGVGGSQWKEKGGADPPPRQPGELFSLEHHPTF